MITEDYVSFEVAKLLKEKGFDECCRAFITPNVSFALEEDCVFNHLLSDNEYAVPTLQMTLKWLREKCDIYVEIILYSITKPILYRWCASKNGRVVSDDEKPDTNVVKCFIHGDDTNFTVHYCTYEDAVEAAIKYCLTNLIK